MCGCKIRRGCSCDSGISNHPLRAVNAPFSRKHIPTDTYPSLRRSVKFRPRQSEPVTDTQASSPAFTARTVLLANRVVLRSTCLPQVRGEGKIGVAESGPCHVPGTSVPRSTLVAPKSQIALFRRTESCIDPQSIELCGKKPEKMNARARVEMPSRTVNSTRYGPFSATPILGFPNEKCIALSMIKHH